MVEKAALAANARAGDGKLEIAPLVQSGMRYAFAISVGSGSREQREMGKAQVGKARAMGGRLATDALARGRQVGGRSTGQGRLVRMAAGACPSLVGGVICLITDGEPAVVALAVDGKQAVDALAEGGKQVVDALAEDGKLAAEALVEDGRQVVEALAK